MPEYNYVTVTQPTPNLPLLRKILAHIKAHPEEWNQAMWVTEFLPGETKTYEKRGIQVPACGTAFCIAGHAVNMMEGYTFAESYDYSDLTFRSASIPGLDGQPFAPAKVYYSAVDSEGKSHPISRIARDALGLTWEEADDLFASYNNMTDVMTAAQAIAARAGEEL